MVRDSTRETIQNLEERRRCAFVHCRLKRMHRTDDPAGRVRFFNHPQNAWRNTYLQVPYQVRHSTWLHVAPIDLLRNSVYVAISFRTWINRFTRSCIRWSFLPYHLDEYIGFFVRAFPQAISASFFRGPKARLDVGQASMYRRVCSTRYTYVCMYVHVRGR